MFKKLFLVGFLLVNVSTFSINSLGRSDISKMYDALKLKGKLDYEIFKRALDGAKKIKEKKRADIITIIDYTKPSTEKRFFLIDIKRKKVLYNTYVSHGKNSGFITPISFANTLNSYKSSLGFYLTDHSYYGKYGYSLRLKGLEPGINSNAMRRSIVVHGANYARAEYVESKGFLGRTEGCPAVPTELTYEIIDKIKGGSIIYVIGNDDTYYEKSKIK